MSQNVRMNFVMYFHHQLFPAAPSAYRQVCSCGKTLFKANSANVVVSNDIGLPWDEYPAGQHMIEVQCHGCRSKYKVLFQ